MATDLYIQRRGQTLIPASAAEACQMDALPEGKALRASVVLPRRNDKFHRLSWAFFGLVAEALNAGPHVAPWSSEDVKDHLLVAAGYSRPITVSGVRGFVPVSTSFHAMERATYDKFIAAAFAHVAGEMAPWIRTAPQWPGIVGILKKSGVEA